MSGEHDDKFTGATDIRDLRAFNRWLCITRLRAAGVVTVAALLLETFGVADIAAARVVLVCLGLTLVSAVGFAFHRLTLPSRAFFILQTLCDLAAITIGIAVASRGEVALLFRFLFVVAIVPPSLMGVHTGMFVATAAVVCHGMLVAAEHGLVLANFVAAEFLIPVVIFYLVAQQSFFYGGHLARKNQALRALAARVDEHRRLVVSEARISTALVEVARTLSATLDASTLLARVTSTARANVAAEWAATFLVDPARERIRLVAAADHDAAIGTLTCVESSLAGWPLIARLEREDLLTIAGEDAARLPGAFPHTKTAGTVLLAALRRDGILEGFLAVGYCVAPDAVPASSMRLLVGIAEHAALVLHNAHLLEEVRAASQLKSEFVGAVSHELRSPLNVILGYAEMLLDGAFGPLAPEQRDALVCTHRQAFAVLEMIDGLLDVNRLEAGRLPVEKTSVAIDDLLAEVVEQLPASCHGAAVAVRLEPSAGLPLLLTDRGKLKTVVRNLVHNALKFTERGSVTLAATRTVSGGVAIRVSDTGRGIPDDALPYIFDMFRQVPGSGGGGVGLGLHIVRRFVEVVGGTVEVRSELGKGTCFTITLPAQDASPQVAA